MKIRLITFHTPKNYGAVLQGYSLLAYLKRFSDDVKVVDYYTRELRKKYPLLPKVISFKALCKNIILFYTVPFKFKKYKKFDNFLLHYYDLTQKFHSSAELYENPPEADCFFTGSDQVFNPNRSKEERQVFYLDFVKKSAIKASYAGSFGVNKIPENREKEIEEYLSEFNYISVRESSGGNLVASLTGKTAVEVLDPVFLNELSFWRRVEQPYRCGNTPYLLYYRLLEDKEADRLARNMAEMKMLRLVTVTDGIAKNMGRVLRDVGPQELLYLMDHADFIVTNAFHGVAFSIIFEKQFLFNDFGAVSSQRGSDILKKCGIEKLCHVNAVAEFKAIDYLQVRKALQTHIEKSKNYIKMIIKSGDVVL